MTRLQTGAEDTAVVQQLVWCNSSKTSSAMTSLLMCLCCVLLDLMAVHSEYIICFVLIVLLTKDSSFL